MKGISLYICERLKISSSKNISNYTPKNASQLRDLVIKLVDERGKDADLNDIDTSRINNMIGIFQIDGFNTEVRHIDISEWDVSNVTTMENMFTGRTEFDSDLSKWDIHNVKSIKSMFSYCIMFKSDLSKWDVSNVVDMDWAFYNCNMFNCDISKWDISNVRYFYSAFKNCRFLNCDLSKWDNSSMITCANAFENCESLHCDFSEWKKPKTQYFKDWKFMFYSCPYVKKPNWYL